jgi:chlorobactene lauroyltransferase
LSKILHNNNEFIPAGENRLFIRIFRIYVKWLFRYRFKNVWLHQDYQPDITSQSVYFLNHTSWWDGLIPLMLNEYLFKQKARAMMEDTQMHKFPFFRYIGAFSVNRNNSRKTISSLRYALQSVQRENSSLFIYPEGKIVPDYGQKLHFENGIGWIYKNCPECDFVPIAININVIKSSKPDLYIKIGQPAVFVNSLPAEQQTKKLEESLQKLLNNLHREIESEIYYNSYRIFL